MSAVVRPSVDEEGPWPGLFPYSEDASRFFNGRERETAELLRLVRRDTLCLLYGQSGLGKSSLIQAGLFPRLRQEGLLPVYLRLDYAARDLELRAQFWQVFSRVLDSHGIDARRPRSDESLWEYFNDAALEFWDARNRALTPVLVLDQFEEVFTTGGAKGAAPAEGSFLRELGDLIDARVPAAVRELLENDPGASARFHFGAPRFRVLFGFREDFLPEFEDLFRALRLPAGSRLRLTRMREEQALEAVRRTGGRLVDGEVAAQIVAFVSGRESAIRVRNAEVEPALLSVVCYELNNRRRQRGETHISSSLLSGAREQIIDEFYHRSLAGTPAPVREFVEEELLTESGFRDSAAIDDALKRPGVTEAAIRDLVEKRVVRLEERFGVLRIELTHDILTPVVRRDRDERQERLRAQAERERERVRQRRSRRLTRIAAAGLLGATVLVVVFAVLLKRAEEEKSRAIQAQSSLFLARGVAALEQNVPREPYRSLAQAIALDPGNRAASARAVSLLTQRRFPALELALPLQANAVRFLGQSERGQLALARDGVVVLLQASAPGSATAELAVSCVREELTAAAADPFVALAPVALEKVGMDEGAGREAEWRIDASRWSATLAEVGRACGKRAQPGRRPAKAGAAKPASGLADKAPAPSPVAARRVGFDAATVTAIYAKEGGELLLAGPEGRRASVSPADAASPVAVVAWDAGRKRAAVAFANGRVDLIAWPADRERHVTVVPATGAAAAPRLQFSPGGEHLLVMDTGAQPRMQLWRLRDGRRLSESALDFPEAAWFSPTGAWLARLVSGAVEFVDASGNIAGRVVRPLAFNHVAMDDRRGVALLSSQDRTATVVRVPSGEVVGAAMLHEGAVTEAGFAPGGAILTASFDATVREWNGATHEPALEPFLHRGPVIWVRALRDGRIASLGEDQQLRLWRRAAVAAASVANLESGTAVEVSRDGRLLSRLRGDGVLEVARIRTAVGGEAVEPFRAISGSQRVSAPYTVGADGSVFAWTSGARKLGWLASDGKAPAGEVAMPEPIRAVDVARDGGLVAAQLADGTIRVIDTRTARPSGLAARIDDGIMAWALTEDGRYLLVAGEGRLQAFDARSGYPVAARPIAGSLGADISRAASAIAYSGGRDLAVWQPGPGVPRRVPLPALVTAVRFAPDGSRVLAVTVDGRVHVRDAATLAEVGPALRHSNAVVRAEFSPDGQWVVTTALDRTIRIWDPVSGQVVADPPRVKSRSTRPLILGDGNWLATIGADGEPVEWRALALGIPLPLPAWFEGYYDTLSGLAGVEPSARTARTGDAPPATPEWANWWKSWKEYVDRRQPPPGG